MSTAYTDGDLLRELEPTVEANLNRHLSATTDWQPHDYVPWGEGQNYAALGGADWDVAESRLSKLARIAMVTNLLTEDNLPSYHREIAQNVGMDGAWGAWVNRWTCEENRHGIALRDYLVVTRAVDPIQLETARVEQVTAGFSPGQQGQGVVFADTLFDSITYVTFQELATRVSHRNTGRACGDPTAEGLLRRISNDENLHMIFYRNVMEASLEIAPNQAIESIRRILTHFQMPGFSMPDFRRNAVTMAVGGIYDTRQHLDDVVMPVLRKWRIFDRTDFSGEGENHRDQLATFLHGLEAEATKFEESRDRYLAREKRRAAAKLG
ncbi:acyl-ACP desaturase [Mycobacterium talmoniae]|uniref:Acyl-ACP desaturase n=1 Tax=Mycobacterium talmoniae TaxID=1858794 RepID=A0A1S1NMG6_9MYCO|nr:MULTISPECIES: acyl-ACP desaturase [Mycobacterium]OHV05148.1 acyl-ACP desaturase [Mycobacterium talmoniae]PQM47123.1 Putative acyl-[acyl-carrier-protein] desaturase DesA1 [Mycobacterium talmoniae]TDH53623.1 acyl-ACP desaturase [Mycobacterium eburneum]